MLSRNEPEVESACDGLDRREGRGERIRFVRDGVDGRHSGPNIPRALSHRKVVVASGIRPDEGLFRIAAHQLVGQLQLPPIKFSVLVEILEHRPTQSVRVVKEVLHPRQGVESGIDKVLHRITVHIGKYHAGSDLRQRIDQGIAVEFAASVVHQEIAGMGIALAACPQDVDISVRIKVAAGHGATTDRSIDQQGVLGEVPSTVVAIPQQGRYVLYSGDVEVPVTVQVREVHRAEKART